MTGNTLIEKIVYDTEAGVNDVAGAFAAVKMHVENAVTAVEKLVSLTGASAEAALTKARLYEAMIYLGKHLE